MSWRVFCDRLIESYTQHYKRKTFIHLTFLISISLHLLYLRPWTPQNCVLTCFGYYKLALFKIIQFVLTHTVHISQAYKINTLVSWSFLSVPLLLLSFLFWILSSLGTSPHEESVFRDGRYFFRPYSRCNQVLLFLLFWAFSFGPERRNGVQHKDSNFFFFLLV